MVGGRCGADEWWMFMRIKSLGSLGMLKGEDVRSSWWLEGVVEGGGRVGEGKWFEGRGRDYSGSSG